MNETRKYSLGYKPLIYSVSLTIKYYNKKYHSHLTSNSKKLIDEGKKHIKEFSIPIALIVLDDKHQFPTDKMKQEFIATCWKRKGIKSNRSEFMIGIRELKIINNHGRVSYDFDEKRD